MRLQRDYSKCQNTYVYHYVQSTKGPFDIYNGVVHRIDNSRNAIVSRLPICEEVYDFLALHNRQCLLWFHNVDYQLQLIYTVGGVNYRVCSISTRNLRTQTKAGTYYGKIDFKISLTDDYLVVAIMTANARPTERRTKRKCNVKIKIYSLTKLISIAQRPQMLENMPLKILRKRDFGSPENPEYQGYINRLYVAQVMEKLVFIINRNELFEWKIGSEVVHKLLYRDIDPFQKILYTEIGQHAYYILYFDQSKILRLMVYNFITRHTTTLDLSKNKSQIQSLFCDLFSHNWSFHTEKKKEPLEHGFNWWLVKILQKEYIVMLNEDTLSLTYEDKESKKIKVREISNISSDLIANVVDVYSCGIRLILQLNDNSFLMLFVDDTYGEL